MTPTTVKSAAKKRQWAQTTSLRLQPKQIEQLDQMAKRAGMNRSALIQLAIARLLEKGL